MIDVLKNKFFTVLQVDKRAAEERPKGFFDAIRYQIFAKLADTILEKYKDEIKQNADEIDYFSDNYSLNLYVFSYAELKQLIDNVRYEEQERIMYGANLIGSLMEAAERKNE